jgi:valyl-tRNA synthetase
MAIGETFTGVDISTNFIQRNEEILKRLTPVHPISEIGEQERDGELANLFWRQGTFEIAIDYEKPIDVAAERERLQKQLDNYDKVLANASRQLNNEAFLKKAPEKVVDGLKKQAAEMLDLREKTVKALKALG